ncbi:MULTISPECIES: hypothetical protein [unclassified Gilliamella]|uniref:hypothetical protein n=1 Tax=unclassified Gilliamella TaxID=2685620 RepID=UPI00080D9F53|nr:hypothetical protein [Gilliamella apicola]OCG33659.1 hypothetical protein A9G32_11495 [Gilliamella apicola]OCG49044.1 hypothetical protein A9G26_09355 [Gilliamella apicola]OCG51792.1 hypothetical protein A9G27_11640 [Gilliamella apicola]
MLELNLTTVTGRKISFVHYSSYGPPSERVQENGVYEIDKSLFLSSEFYKIICYTETERQCDDPKVPAGKKLYDVYIYSILDKEKTKYMLMYNNDDDLKEKLKLSIEQKNLSMIELRKKLKLRRNNLTRSAFYK